MKLLLTDVSHALGRALEHEFEREPFGLITPGSAQVDWTDIGEVRAYLEHQPPTLVINTLGWADRPDTAQCVLIPAAARVLAQVCEERGVPLLQFSSYRVFGGDSKSTHAEKDDPAPQSEAGRAWLAAEQAVTECLEQRLLLRLSWLIDSHGDNRLTRLLSALFSHPDRPVAVSARFRGTPTALSDVARVVVGIVRQVLCGAHNWGVMHYVTRPACSEAAFAEKVMEVLRQLDALPEAAALESVETLPPDEPVSAVLGFRRLKDNFGVQSRQWEPYLVPMIKQWLAEAETRSGRSLRR